MKIKISQATFNSLKTYLLLLIGGLLIVFLLEWEGVLIFFGCEDLVIDLYFKYAP